MVGVNRLARRPLHSRTLVSAAAERKRGGDPGNRRAGDLRSLGLLDRPAPRARELTGARLYPVALGIERGYDAITPRRLHRGAPSKTTTPGKRRIFHVARTVPSVHLPHFRARLRAHRLGGAGAGARRSGRPAILAAGPQRRAGEIAPASLRD